MQKANNEDYEMKKIPTMFERDWDGDRSRVLDKPHPDCAWVFAGEGVATRKYDGMCTAVIGGKFFKRREVKPDQATPMDMEIIGKDDETGKIVGWVPVGDGPEDKYLREAFANTFQSAPVMDGTFEFVGPKAQGNVEKSDHHLLLLHGCTPLPDAPRTFDGLREYLSTGVFEGIVFHHPDGRMAKIKGRDFGIKRSGK